MPTNKPTGENQTSKRKQSRRQSGDLGGSQRGSSDADERSNSNERGSKQR